MWEKVGIARTKESLTEAIDDIRNLKEEFWNNLRLTGEKNTFNKYLEFAGRVADFLELGELMAVDALHRNESCGCHLREEYQTPEGEALRNDDDFAYVAAWKYQGDDQKPELNKEPLKFENVKLSQRSYK
jgi:succinate dehydrogenase / fumarate reductase flavoprotein subunit